LQETVSILNKKFLIVGIGINLVKSPNINDYPTTNLEELTNKIINKNKIENELKQIFDKNLSKMYKKSNKKK
jgi:BirA family biotin operon repressor/biotin-[acetyl-CoA-carboxylase] ligase